MLARLEELAKFKLAEPSVSDWKTESSQNVPTSHRPHNEQLVPEKGVNIQMDVAKTLASWRTIPSEIKSEEVHVDDDEGVHEEESHSDTASSPHTSSSTGVSSDAHSNPGSHASDHSDHEPVSSSQPNEHVPDHQADTTIDVSGPLSAPVSANPLPPIESLRNFTYLPPIKVETKEFQDSKSREAVDEAALSLNLLNPSAIKHISVKTDHPVICTGARFSSFAEFEAAFELWKNMYHHPFRVASSETLRQPDGSPYEVFRYRYIVYHCAHYGVPRMRGVGKRPNQNYLPCGCKAMLRLNFNYGENALRITTLNDLHTGHEVTAENYARISAKVRKISPNSMDSEDHSPRSSKSSSASVKSHPSPAQSSQKPSPSEASFYSNLTSPMVNYQSSELRPPITMNSTPTSTSVVLTPTSSAAGLNLLSTNSAFAPPTSQANIVSLLASISQQQQRERAAAAAAFLAQHKENLLLAARNSTANVTNQNLSSNLANGNPLALLQNMLNQHSLNSTTGFSNTTNAAALPNLTMPTEPTSLLPSNSQLTQLLAHQKAFSSRPANFSDYIMSLKNASNISQVQTTASQNPIQPTVVKFEANPTDSTQNMSNLQAAAAPKTAPTQAQLMDAEKILTAVGEHLSRCSSFELDERLRQLLLVLHSWNSTPNSNTSR